jgi:molybdenum cofactor guanylyltransferase
MQETLGVILAGGLSRRMGGGDKGLVELGGHSLLSRVVSRLGPQLCRLVINANGDPARFSSLGLPVIADRDEARHGPLAGILAGLDHAAKTMPGVDHILAAPCDAPFLPADLVSKLASGRRAAGGKGAIATSSGRRHPAVALWPVAGRRELRNALAEGRRRVDDIASALGLVEVDWPAEPFDPFLNVNDPAGLERAAEILRAFPRA